MLLHNNFSLKSTITVSVKRHPILAHLLNYILSTSKKERLPVNLTFRPDIPLQTSRGHLYLSFDTLLWLCLSLPVKPL